MKACSRCKQEKPESEYYWANKQRGQLQYRCKTCHSQVVKVYHENNREKIKEAHDRWMDNGGREIQRAYRQNNKEKQRAYQNSRYKDDVQFRLGKLLRRRLSQFCFNNKSKRTFEYLGMDAKTFKTWLEYQFDEDMNWENQGTYWDMDHVKPCTAFDLELEEHKDVCFHWTNIRPLEKVSNIKKRDKVCIETIHRHAFLVNSFLAFNPGAKAVPKGAAGVE